MLKFILLMALTLLFNLNATGSPSKSTRLNVGINIDGLSESEIHKRVSDKRLDILEDRLETFDIISSANIYQELYPLEDGTTVTVEIESFTPLTEAERGKLKFIMEKHLSEDETLSIIYTEHK